MMMKIALNVHLCKFRLIISQVIMDAKSSFKYFSYFSCISHKTTIYRESTVKRVYNGKLQKQPFKKRSTSLLFRQNTISMFNHLCCRNSSFGQCECFLRPLKFNETHINHLHCSYRLFV